MSFTLAGKSDDAEAFVSNLAQRVLKHEDELMTIAQQLEQKGLEQSDCYQLDRADRKRPETNPPLTEKGLLKPFPVN
ncbi:hypothetical protein IAE30_27165 [Pantoea sp. S61]|nr:hypothetical protein [Pantoea sp. S61]